MRQGYKVIDVDTHVTPSYEVLMRYADAALQARASEIEPHVRRTKPVAGRGHPNHEYGVVRVNPYPYDRMAGRKDGAVAETANGHGSGGHSAGAGARGALEGRTSNDARKPVRENIQHDNAAGRLLDMDTEGVDINLIIPGTWAPGSSALELELGKLMHQAYHRYLDDYTSADTRRLKAIVLAHAGDPKWAARQVQELAEKDWVAGVWLVLPEGLPVDDPDLDPIFSVMNEANLPIVHHSFFYEAPYFPGYRDVWGNAAFARTAAHVWGAQRLMGYVLISGLLDRYPNLRVGTVETGHGWLPNFILRLDKQIRFVAGGTVPPELAHTPIEFVEMGRVFSAIEPFEGPQMTKAVIDILGDHVLMYESDFPHPECMFPDTTDHVIGWRNVIGEDATRKLMGGNPMRFLRLLSTPWDGEGSGTGTTAAASPKSN